MSSLIPLAAKSAAHDAGSVISHPVGVPLRDRVRPRPNTLPLAWRPARVLGRLILLIATVAVAAPVFAVAGALALLGFAVGGPWLSLALLLPPFAILALLATGASG